MSRIRIVELDEQRQDIRRNTFRFGNERRLYLTDHYDERAREMEMYYALRQCKRDLDERLTQEAADRGWSGFTADYNFHVTPPIDPWNMQQRIIVDAYVTFGSR